MSDVRCPRCGDSFRIPDADIPAGARARCPWCDETLPVSELLSSLPPMAVLISEGDHQPIAATETSETVASNPWEQHGAQGDQSATQIDSAGSADNESLSATESDWLSDASDDQRMDRDEDLDELLEIDDSDQLTGDTEPVEPRPLQEVSDMTFGREARAVATKPRQRKKSSPLRSILGIVIGGLMALPLAAVILALFGKPLDIGIWPFDGKTIATGSSARTAAPPVMPPPSGSRPPAPPQGRSLAEDLPGNGEADAAPADDAFPPAPLEPSDPQTPMIFPLADEPVTSDGADLLAGDDAANRFDRSAASVPGDSGLQASPDPTAIVPPSSGPELIDPPPSDPTLSDEDAAEPERRTIDSPEQPQPAPASVDEATAEDSTLTLPDLEPPDLDLSAEGPNMSVAAARIDRQDAPAAPAPEEETAADSDEGQSVTPEAPDAAAPAEAAAPEISTATPETTTPDASDVETSDAAEDAAAEPTAPEAAAPAGDAGADMTPASQRRLSTPQLEAALVVAEEAVQAVESYDDAEGTAGLKRRLATLYSSIAAAGEIAAPADESELTALIDRLTTNNLVKDLAPAAANWLKYSKRPNDGMLAVGALRQENEKWFLDWSGAAPLEIRWTDQAAAQEHAQVLVLGRIVNADQAAPVVEATLVKPIE